MQNIFSRRASDVAYCPFLPDQWPGTAMVSWTHRFVSLHTSDRSLVVAQNINSTQWFHGRRPAAAASVSPPYTTTSSVRLLLLLIHFLSQFCPRM